MSAPTTRMNVSAAATQRATASAGGVRPLPAGGAREPSGALARRSGDGRHGPHPKSHGRSLHYRGEL
jgi:hypothetical protein